MTGKRATGLQPAPRDFQGMGRTTGGLTEYLKGCHIWDTKNSLILPSIPPFVQAMYFKLNLLKHAFTSKSASWTLSVSSPYGDTTTLWPLLCKQAFHTKQLWAGHAVHYPAVTNQRQPFSRTTAAVTSASRGLNKFGASGRAIPVYHIHQCFRRHSLLSLPLSP